MSTIWAKQALIESGWAQNVRVNVDSSGRIENVEANAEPSGTQVGILLPAPVNAHSHAFQRAMAGLTERRGPDPRDSFWTWRQLMFRFLDQLTPEHVQAIAAFVQMEMLEAGYATNVEFHYLHHQPGGTPYDNLSEMSDRIAAATKTSGIGLTMLPVYYQFGGCDRRALGPGQIRFGNDPDRFAKLIEGVRSSVASLTEDCTVGIAPHSLRAISPEGLIDVFKAHRGGSIHMHLAEQIAEVEEIQDAWGKRPVEWLLEHHDVDEKWCLIHCTQMQPHETRHLAETGAVAGLCPITESSLGDGIFDGVRWLDHGGRIAIGSDSNIRISLSEELRTLEYSQRLRDRSRAALATPKKSTGRRMFDAAVSGGAQAAGRNTGRIAPGAWGDLLALDASAVDLANRENDSVLDSFIFAGNDALVSDVWSAGRHLVRNSQHIKHDTIKKDYLAAVGSLSATL